MALMGGALGAATAGAAGEKTVTYRGYQVKVPVDWAVVDLAKEPTACVRLDRAAVYLGRSAAQADCPAGAVGRSTGLVLEPLDRAPRSSDGEFQVAAAEAGVLATAYYPQRGERQARAVLATGKVVSRSSAVARVPRQQAAAPTLVATGTVNGYAFDTCAAPAQETMDAWLPPNSDYKAVGIYISGGLRKCDQPNLTPDWVATNAAKGWQYLLIDVGMQAPCTTYSSRMSDVPATALAQGKAAAAQAVASAQALGFAPRSAIYSDIETYDNRIASCKAAVLSYLSGWTQELTSSGYVGGAYVGAASGGADLSAAYNSTAYTRPDNLWFAHWGVAENTSRFIPATYWPNHQRVHQFKGDTSETHGGVTVKIDRNKLDLTPPPPMTGLSVTGSAGTATLRWTAPAGTSVGQYVVRSAPGTKAPALPTTGTSVYAGTATTAVASGLANSSSYAFRTWVKDSTGKLSPPAEVALTGTSASVKASASAIMYTGAVTLTTAARRVDTGAALANAPIHLYSRAKNATRWALVTRLTTSATGAASSVQKPAVSTYYMWGYNGSVGLLGTRSAAVLVEVRPAMSAYLSPASIRLNGASSFYGYLNPAHAGMPVYLQRLSGTKWMNVTNTKLTTNGKYTFGIRGTARGTFSYRVVWYADADHQGTQTSAKVLTVS